MVFISDHLQAKVDAGELTKDIGKSLGITPAMVGQYRLNRGYRPSLKVAMKIYKNEGIALHPFSAESLQWELDNA